MDARDLYQPLGEWLIKEKGCQSNDYFLGYTTEPQIHNSGGLFREPDVVAVQYESRETETVSFDFHFHVVEVKAGTTPGQIQNLIGGIEALQQFIDDATLAADSVTYYCSIPTIEIPPTLRSWAEENGVGVIGLEISDGRVTVIREVIEPSRREFDLKRSEFLSNKDQGSVGTFIEAVENTSVLNNIMVPREFYEEEIRPGQEEYHQKMNRKHFLSCIENDSSRTTASELLTFFDKIDGMAVDPPSSGIRTGKVSLSILGKEDENVLTLVPQRRNFKIQDPNGEVLFRISGKDEIECFDTDIGDFPALKSYLGSFANS